jgi:predicted MFS family arabinose efflux permease
LAGPLSSPAIRLVVAAAVLFGTGDGAIQVAVAGFAVRHGSERLAGLLLTALSAGSVAAGLVYGTRSWRWSWPARFAALNLLLGTAVGLAAPAMGTGWPPAVAAALLLGGLAVAPIAIESSMLVGAAAPPGTVTEAFALLVTAVVAGGAAGSAVAGQLLDRLGAAPTMLLAAVPPIAAGVATSLCRRAVGAESEAESEPPP